MTDSELVILHLLAEKPRHGYEMEEVIEERGMREWTAIGFSSIYYLLNKLEKAGMVEKSAAAAERGPSRNVFNLTASGLQTLRQEALTSLASHQGDYKTLLMGLANLPLLTQEEALPALIMHRDELSLRIDHIAQQLERQQPVPGTVEVLFDYSFTMIGSRLAWLTTFIEQIEGGQFTWPEEISQNETGLEENNSDTSKD